MKSADSYELGELEQNLPTSREDILAMRSAREAHRLSLEEYLAFLASFPPPGMSALRVRKGPSGSKPFEL
jgi:hypothetical protein